MLPLAGASVQVGQDESFAMYLLKRRYPANRKGIVSRFERFALVSRGRLQPEH